MSKLGINTGTVPNDGTGDTLLQGAIKINSNFDEIYNKFGDGTNLTSISIGGTWAFNSVGVHTLRNVGIGTTNPTSALTVKGNTSLETLSVSGVSTLGIVTAGNIYSTGIITATTFSGSNTLKERTTVTGVTTSIANNGIGNTNITGFKSYALMKVGLSTAGWLRLYTNSTSRANDVSRSVGIDPTPGSGVIAEVVTTGISTTQIISPFVMGGNLDDPADTTIYASITNLSGTTQAITANLTILQLEA